MPQFPIGAHGWESDAVVIHEDRELLAELARLNGDMASFARRIMDGSWPSGSVTMNQERRPYLKGR
ncbi:MAG: hypothetical protein ACRDTF_22175 [Pseudonocardiaceae bacterium]